MKDFEDTPFDPEEGDESDTSIPDDPEDNENLIPERGDQLEDSGVTSEIDFSEDTADILDDLDPDSPKRRFAAFLAEHPEVAPDSVQVMSHIPPLIGGIKSAQFIVASPDATPDTPPDPAAVFDINSTTVEMTAGKEQPFFDFFSAVEAQADNQYPIALFETEQLLSNTTGEGAGTDTIFIPDTVNSSASGYFRRLARLAQDTGRNVVIHVAGSDSDGSYGSFRRFEPVTAEDVEVYWQERARHVLAKPPERAPGTDDAVALQALAYAAPPADYHWSGRYDQLSALRTNLRIAAHAAPERLKELLLDEESLVHEKLPLIQLAAYGNPEAWGDDAVGPARTILAKIGDMAGLRQIRTEIRDRTGGAGSMSQTAEPLSIYLSADPELLKTTQREVDQMITSDPGWHEVHSLLGALYRTGDPSIGEWLAGTLVVPEHHAQGYARQVLFAAVRWMPEYTARLQAMPPSPERDAALAAIEGHVKTFIDADSEGRLDDILGYMPYKTDRLVPTLFSFRNPEHQATLRKRVLTEFERGGSLLVDSIYGSISRFEQAYIMYREQYGDLPEISRMLKP